MNRHTTNEEIDFLNSKSKDFLKTLNLSETESLTFLTTVNLKYDWRDVESKLISNNVDIEYIVFSYLLWVINTGEITKESLLDCIDNVCSIYEINSSAKEVIYNINQNDSAHQAPSKYENSFKILKNAFNNINKSYKTTI